MGARWQISAFPSPAMCSKGPGMMWTRRGEGDTAGFPKPRTRLLAKFWEYRAFYPEASQGLWVEAEPFSELLRSPCVEIQPEAPELSAWA